ncbi:DUF308 domain-containing protein [Segatella baroniae]|uniref:HdeD family acid-resistance protein n=1 Tax=Segatella baroniae TaxID=305719 RepID=UPI0028E30188|nr:DUF308 domain-containing protein [Segatella baroniae]
MRVLQSSFFRAIIAIVIGALLVQYREQTVQWITIAIGVMFFLSGIISCATYFSARRSAASTVPLFDDDGQRIEPLRPNFPIVGLGSLILGVILALMPATFIDWLMYIMAAILILGAVNQFVNLASARKFAHVGAFYWVMPSLILLVGLLAILYPRAIASAPLFVLGWCMMVYGVVESLNSIKIHRCRRAFAKAEEARRARQQLQQSADSQAEDATTDKAE